MNLLDTIAAISTPYGKGGVAMIRISGADAIHIVDRVFRPFSGKKLSEAAHASMVYGEIFMPDGSEHSVDDGMAVVFREPRSFTGEDTVEITCHGGILVTRKVLSAVLCAGARLAEAGEFTRRAFISGKMKLTEAEALGNLLEARSESQLTLARGGMKGRLSDRMEELYSSLLRVLSGIYAAIDFPDEDLSSMSREEMENEISRVCQQVSRLAKTYGTGKAINEGIPTVICGRANAGKSSVYNRILGYDAAIVTDIEGTTRDILRQEAVIGKVTLLLCDTAGIRQTDDKVEAIGIERSLKEIGEAGFILAIFDGSREMSNEDYALVDRIKQIGVPAIALINKSDLGQSDMSEHFSGLEHVIHVSATTGEGFDDLERVIEEIFIDGELDMGNDAVVTEARQYAALISAEGLLCRALEDIKAGMSLDACCVGVECAMSELGEVDGREIGEEIVLDIFSRFCVGK